MCDIHHDLNPIVLYSNFQMEAQSFDQYARVTSISFGIVVVKCNRVNGGSLTTVISLQAEEE